jgi:hypothetical protein
MTVVPQYRQLCYAALSTLVALGYFLTQSRGSDGGWIFWWAIGLFALLVALDWFVTARGARNRDLVA